MSAVFVVVREYDVEGYRISGIFEDKTKADAALERLNSDGYGTVNGNRVVEVKLNTYFDIGDIGL